MNTLLLSDQERAYLKELVRKDMLARTQAGERVEDWEYDLLTKLRD